MSYFSNYSPQKAVQRSIKNVVKIVRATDVADGDLIVKKSSVQVFDFTKDGTHVESFRDISLAATIASGAIDKMKTTSMSFLDIDAVNSAFESLPRPLSASSNPAES